MASPIRIGSTFLVNALHAGSQVRAVSEGLANGRLFVTYESLEGSPTPDFNIYGQMMSGSGTSLPAAFVLHPTSTAWQQYTGVTQLANGKLLAVWTDKSGTMGDVSQNAVHGQYFTTAGAKLGSDFLVNKTVSGDQSSPAVAALKGGGFVATWADNSGQGGDSNGYGIKARVYGADGTAGAEFRVNTTTPGNQNAAHVTALSNGGFAVTWADNGATGGDEDAYIQRGRIYSAAGVAVSNEIKLDVTHYSTNSASRVVGLTNGDVAFVWVSKETTGADANGTSIRTAIYSAKGVLKDAEVQVNTTTVGDQNAPTAVALRDGRFMVAWVDASAGAGHEAIRAQVMNADGTKSFSEFIVHSSGFSGGTAPNLTEMADGRVFVSWTNPDGSFDGSETSIAGQYIDPRIAGFTLTGTAEGDIYRGSAYADIMKGVGGNDTLSGGGGNDVLSGGAGNDRLDGGTERDRADYSGSAAVTVNLALTGAQVTGQGTDTLVSIEHITSGGGNDRLTGNGLGNSLSAGLGKDSLYGGLGNDTLSGGGGNDVLSGGAGNDRLDGGTERDRADYSGSAAVTVNLALTGAQVTGQGTDTLVSIEHITSGGGNDRLTGNGLGNSLSAGLGKDSLYGGLGNDTLSGGGGNDVLSGGAGNDRLDGGTERDRADYSGSAAVTVNLALTGAQVTGQGTDTLVSIEHITSGGGNDRLTGNGLGNSLSAGLGKDSLYGGLGNDTLSGGGGNDKLYGGAGADMISGGGGRDVLTGGGGADHFVFTSATETGHGAMRDQIAYFSHGADQIVLKAFMHGGHFIGGKAFTGHDDEVRYVHSTGILSGDVNGDKVVDWEIAITNKATLTTDDFTF